MSEFPDLPKWEMDALLIWLSRLVSRWQPGAVSGNDLGTADAIQHQEEDRRLYSEDTALVYRRDGLTEEPVTELTVELVIDLTVSWR